MLVKGDLHGNSKTDDGREKANAVKSCGPVIATKRVKILHGLAEILFLLHGKCASHR